MKSRFIPKRVIALALLLGVCTIFVYLPALNLGFVNWDDNEYIYENPHILTLTGSFVSWAFTTFSLGNWHPMTWLSYGIDRLLWGTGAMGFHATNILLHGLNTALVTILTALLISAGTNTVSGEGAGNSIATRSMVTAAVTGILHGMHPIHVESVAWISERKDVLCAFFFLGGILAYIRYVWARHDGISPESAQWGRSSRFYFLTLFLFVLSILSKPMAVTFPIVLLLLDWHPLGRFDGGERRSSVLVEKIPFFMLSLASVVVTIGAQKYIGDVLSLSDVPLLHRLLNGSRAFILYLWNMLIPLNLIPFYSYPTDVSFLSVKYIGFLMAAVGLTASCVMLVQSKRGRSWTAAWSYYLITLLPVLGLIQVGNQSMADRYMYLPSIGPFLLAGLGFTMVFERKNVTTKRSSFKGYSALILMGVLAISLSYLTVRQTGVWRDGFTLWNYVIDKNPASFAKVYNNRGLIYLEQNRPAEALRDFNTAVASAPGILKWYFNRAKAYRLLGQYDKAIENLSTVVKWDPKNIKVYIHRGNTYLLMDQFDEAIADYEKALEIIPNSYTVYFNLGKAYSLKKHYDKAIDNFSKAVSLNARFADAYCERGVAYIALERYDEAIEECSSAISINANVPRYYYYRGTAYTKRRFYMSAVDDFTKAISISAEPKAEYYSERGLALKKLGKLAEGKRDLFKAKQLGSEPYR